MLAPLRQDPASTGIFCDFDGTLAPIVDDPAAALAVPGTAGVLAGLASRYARVGIISGRPAAFLAEHFAGRGLMLSGLYGLEEVTAEGVVSNDAAEAWRSAVDEVAGRTERAGIAGVGVERKGLSVTLHYRTDPALEPETRLWAETEAQRTGLVVHAARMSYELRPPVPCTKGTVLAEAGAGLGAVCFMGDDHADIEAFDVLDALQAGGTHCLRVAVASTEAPAELLARADAVVDGPTGVLALLRRL
ncbi:MAG: trehalose-phosphatase [Acidimicrobiales bacterium]